MIQKISLLLLLSAFPCFCQNYSVTKTTALSASAEVITVQQPATSARFLKAQAVYVDCSAACTITLERNGTAATTTTLAVRNINPGETVASATAFSASNVGTGTVLGTYNIAAGGGIVIDLTAIQMYGGNKSSNFTLRTNSITATVDLVITFSETSLP